MRSNVGDDNRDDNEMLDLAVVGGGVAGLYTAWRAVTANDAASLGDGGIAPRVGVFEHDERLGGRLYSWAPPGAPHLRAELGAMCHTTAQTLLVTLIDQLGLEVAPFPLADEHTLNFLRGSRFNLADQIASSDKVPYDLAPSQRGKPTGQVFMEALDTVIPGVADLSHDQQTHYERTVEIEGRPIYEWPMYDLIHHLLDGDAAEMVIDGMGYICVRDKDISASNLLHSNKTAGSFMHLVEGFQALPLGLADGITAAGGIVEGGTSLVSLEPGSSSGPGGRSVVLVLEHDGEVRRVEARRVVLALPRRALQLLDPDCFLRSDHQFSVDLDSVVPVPASKLFLAYEQPWWHELGISWGRSVTDQPMRQCVYFGTEATAPYGEPGNLRSLLKASYNDGEATRHWESFIDRSHPFEGEQPVPPDSVASANMVNEVQRELGRLHGVEPPEPYWAAFRDWNTDPFGAGWHYWRVGHRSYEVMPRIRKPLDDVALFTCGEAFSANQGWVIGSLSTAELVVRDHLGLAEPGWLPDSVELGP